MVKDKRFKEAYNLFDPKMPLMGENLQYYVPRQIEIINQLKRQIEASDGDTKILFSGIPGCGKSTELTMLLKELKTNYFTVFISVTDMMEVTDVQIADLLLVMCIKLYEKTQQEKLKIDQTVINNVKDWFKEVTRIKHKEEGSQTHAGFVLKYLLEVGARLRTESTTRLEIRDRVKHRLSDLIDRMNDLIHEIEVKCSKEVILSVDDLDKPDLKIVENLFHGNSNTLTSPECKIIYVVPLSLLYTEEFRRIEQQFHGRPIILPVTKLWNRDGSKNKSGFEEMKKVITARVSLDLFESAALDEIIKSSGGVLRELCKNVQHCCLLSMEKVERINVDIVKKMLANLCNQFVRQVSPSTYPKYRQINQTKWIEEEERARLLSSLNVLEYINDELWYDLHPVLKVIVDKTGDV